MALPLSRDYDATPAAPVASATTNNLQDSVIGAKHGTISRFLSAYEGRSGTALPGAYSENPIYWQASSGGGLFTIPLVLKPGDRLLSLSVRHYSGGGVNKEIHAYRATSGGVYGLLPTWTKTFNPVDLVIAEEALDGTDYLLLAGESLYLRYIADHAADRLYGVTVTWDRP